MTKATDKTAKWQGASNPMPFAGMAGFNGNFLEVYAQAVQALFENAFAVNQELVRFSGERLQTDMEALQTLSQCKNWQDMSRFQSEFAQSAAESYQAEISRLMEKSTEAATAALKPLEDSTKALFEAAAQD